MPIIVAKPARNARNYCPTCSPEQLVGSVLGGYPFFGGVLILISRVLTLGSDYGWGTLKTLFTQRPGRLQVFGAKLIALGIAIIGFVVSTFAVAAAASAFIANREDAPINWPDASLLLKGMAAAWSSWPFGPRSACCSRCSRRARRSRSELASFTGW